MAASTKPTQVSSVSLPTQHSERAAILDVLRGFALLGVLFDNILIFTGWGNLSQSQREALSTWPADGILGCLELAFVKGKFYSVFSLLFGIGFSIIMLRNEQKGTNALVVFYRRLTVLFFIGAAHLYLLWDGDISLLYALLGFLLPLFRRCSDRALLIWAVAFLLSPLLIDFIKVWFNVSTGSFLQAIAQSIGKKNGVPADETVAQYLFGPGAGWKEWRNWQEPGFFYRYAYLIDRTGFRK